MATNQRCQTYAPPSLVISMAMRIRRYDAERIAQYGRSRATLDTTGFSLSHAPVPLMHLPVVLSTLPPPLNLSTCNLCLLRPRHLLSTGAFPPVCLSLAGWLSCCQLLHASASRHLLSHSRLTRPSLTPILRSRQLVVALPLRTTFAS